MPAPVARDEKQQHSDSRIRSVAFTFRFSECLANSHEQDSRLRQSGDSHRSRRHSRSAFSRRLFCSLASQTFQAMM